MQIICLSWSGSKLFSEWVILIQLYAFYLSSVMQQTNWSLSSRLEYCKSGSLSAHRRNANSRLGRRCPETVCQLGRKIHICDFFNRMARKIIWKTVIFVFIYGWLFCKPITCNNATYYWKPLEDTLANSKEPDKMPQSAIFYWGMYCLPRPKQSSVAILLVWQS